MIDHDAVWVRLLAESGVPHLHRRAKRCGASHHPGHPGEGVPGAPRIPRLHVIDQGYWDIPVTSGTFPRHSRTEASRWPCEPQAGVEDQTVVVTGKRNVRDVLDQVPELWSPHVVKEVNDYDVKAADVAGDYPEHVHEDTDEVLLVLVGRLTDAQALPAHQVQRFGLTATPRP